MGVVYGSLDRERRFLVLLGDIGGPSTSDRRVCTRPMAHGGYFACMKSCTLALC